MSSILSVHDLKKRFAGREVLGGVSFELAPDTVTVVLGANGAGKTTLMRCVLGLLVPDAGRVRVLGLDPMRSARAVRHSIGYVPDAPDVYPWMTLRELFRFLRAQIPDWSDERAVGLAEQLQATLDVRFASMSRGEAAKGMLAATLAPAPRLVLLDEPFARLAPPAREDVMRTFLAEVPVSGGGALVATHDLDVAARVADRILVLAAGRIAADVDVADLVASLEGRSGLPEALRNLYPDREPAETAR